MNSVEVDDGACFFLFDSFVKLVKHLVQVTLLPQNDCLIVVYLEQLLFKIEGFHSCKAFLEDVEAVGAAGDTRRFCPIASLFECIKACAHEVKLIFIILNISLLHNGFSQIDARELIEPQAIEDLSLQADEVALSERI